MNFSNESLRMKLVFTSDMRVLRYDWLQALWMQSIYDNRSRFIPAKYEQFSNAYNIVRNNCECNAYCYDLIQALRTVDEWINTITQRVFTNTCCLVTSILRAVIHIQWCNAFCHMNSSHPPHTFFNWTFCMFYDGNKSNVTSKILSSCFSYWHDNLTFFIMAYSYIFAKCKFVLIRKSIEKLS